MRPGMGHSLMPSFSTRSTCRPTKAISSPGITKTCIAKNRDSVAPAMIGPPSTSFTSHGPKHGNAAHNRCSDAQSPIGVLVESHHLSRKAHAERHQQKEDAEHPRQLARIFVGAEEEDLSHVDQDNGDHEVRAPAMQGSNEPPERDVVIENLQAVPGLSRGGHVDQRKQNSGDDLKQENGERGAAEDVKPACGICAGPGARPFREWTRQACRRWSSQAPTFPIRRMAVSRPFMSSRWDSRSSAFRRP